ncbi:hypothetical protein SAMN02745174_02278 [Cetobacterium ceti]|uniref:Bacteriophage lambda head decoration protein D n=1 Tax=Cetobacterium ceti TaxID=180163 RepID=A0A1T4QCV2_9FUSO|nr:hypothetical protein [Cetobacterium ceti]SKA01579.1 hypothetical protein SAMN02745174_02278 [Cetobacterium ceti]
MKKTEIKTKVLVAGNDITPTTYKMPCTAGEYKSGTIVEWDTSTKKMKPATAAANMFGIIVEDITVGENGMALVYVTGRFDFTECIIPTVHGESKLDYQIKGKEIGIFFAE